MPGDRAAATSANTSFIGQLREFQLNITDWNIYKARLKNYFSANDITDSDKKKAIFLNMLDEESYKIIFSICSPELPEAKSFDALIQLFDRHFQPKKSVLAERFKFFASRKEPEETIREWAARLRSLAVSCEFEAELDICLRDRFVCGFGKGIILDRLLEEDKNITFEQAITVAENKMAASQSYQISQSVKTEPINLIRNRSNDRPRHRSGDQRHAAAEKSSGKPKQHGCSCCLGKFNKGNINLKLKDTSVTPKFFRARPIPYALQEPVENEINRLLSLGIISPVDYCKWGTPVVPVLKKNGSVRLCGDYKVTINPCIEVDQYPLPRIEDLFRRLQGGSQFSKMDLSDAYQQICLDEESKELTTIVTHKGLFKYNRLTYGISSAPSKFQKLMESLLSGLEGVVVFLDDILVTGKDEIEHLSRLREVLKILKNSGLKLSPSKCKFFQNSVEYLGYIIDREGLHTSESKTLAIENFVEPKNVSELKSFLGMVNYYGKFVKNLSTVLYPLHQLLKKDAKWEWTESCKKSFQNIKYLLKSTEVLVHFDPNLKIKLTIDASPHGIGAILSHTYPSGAERPIAYASKSLTRAEKNYSQIEREGLAIIFGVIKFHQYLYAKRFTLVTDNKPLMAIFGNKKSIPQFSANRLRRWAVILSNYDYEIEYVKSTENNADALSRMLPETSTQDTFQNDVDLPYCNFLAKSDRFPVNFEEVQKETLKDVELSKIKDLMIKGWPKYVNDPSIRPYFSRRSEFAISDNCLFWNHRIVVPTKLRQDFLGNLHLSHLGIVKMKSIARSHFWWPNLDKDIERLVKKCIGCSSNSNNPPKVPLAGWKWPTEVWQRLHIDFLGPIKNKHYLIVLDAHSKWLEVFESASTSTQMTVKFLRQSFARFGLPETIVSDNASCFTSADFQDFLKNNNISHVTSPPFHPQSNGAAENSVKTIKNCLKRSFSEGTPVDTNTILSRFLLDYRTTKHTTTGVSPSQLMFGRNIRTRFDALLHKSPCKSIENRVRHNQQVQKQNFKGKNKVNFEVNDVVIVKDYRDPNSVNWIKGQIVKKVGKVTFLVKIFTLDRIWKRHSNQIMKTFNDINYPVKNVINNETILNSSSETDVNRDNVEVDPPVVHSDRPKRIVKPPKRFVP
ncbi:uncharacterized protein K02A2.6-like [Coccinella septempunctata]|uniref:uncharacterized protein K02A2.6-like n=1 Tax=Coccinella septempunctata TaxID=41139 RepID=UPI001D088022|nr:uncharacterized protein K02A2.6-like [Coccinella septempunctata]